MDANNAVGDRQQMPGMVIGALVGMWTLVAANLLWGVSNRLATGAPPLSDALYHYPVQTVLPWALAALMIATAVNFRRRKNWARVTAMVVSAIGTVNALFVIGAAFATGLVALVVFGVLYALLITATAKAWCGLPPRRRRART